MPRPYGGTDPEKTRGASTSGQTTHDLARRSTGEVARRTGAGAVAGPAAVYDTVTEGLTGWQFLRTWRWAGYLAIAVVFALVCGALALWQYDRGRGATADNHLYSSNFALAPESLSSALPTLETYSPDQVWRAVQLTGRWDASQQYYVRNSVRSGNSGFDVVTALRLDTGATFLVDRGWVKAASDGTEPKTRPIPPTGTVNVVARLQPSQAQRGEGGVSDHQIESVELPMLAPLVGGRVYSAAWGVIIAPKPPATSPSTRGMSRIQATAPAEGVGYHYSYMIQWILFALIGFFLLWRAAIREFRRINADDPDEQLREAARVQKRAKKAFTDEEVEDETLDGYLPLSRWTGRAGLPIAGSSAPVKPALTGTPIPFDAVDDDGTSDTDDAPAAQDGQVFVLEAQRSSPAATQTDDVSREGPEAGEPD